MDKEKIGVLNEIGDLGLGFYPISEQEKNKIEKNKKEIKEDK